MRLPSVRSLPFLLALLLCWAVPARAQTGSIEGTVRDVVNNTPVVGARVEAVAPDGRAAASTTTDESGRYRLTGLAPGNYRVVISGTGFDAREVGVSVGAGRASIANATVAAGNVQLDPLVVSASKRPEKALDAPARVEVVSEREIDARPVVTPVEHLRGVPGVDIAQTGVQSTTVTARGFNNIFSGALHALSDYRIAGVPSLRANFLQFVPSTNEDISRMEVVLGPGAALYGPNTADGILHILTKSPLDAQETTLTAAGSPNQDVFHGTFRTAQALGNNFGIKLSGQYLRAQEWAYTDPVEVAERQKFATNLAFFRQDLMRATGITQAEADVRIARIGARDNDIDRWSAEARADWRVTRDLTTVFAVGTTTLNGIELTGLGAGQAKDWRYTYYQARANWGRFFGQLYLNTSDAGETFLLRNGAPITDRSRLFVAQLQHGFSLGGTDWQRFTYGGDFLYTLPITGGSINGIYEDDDDTQEFGAYLQSETQLTDQLELVLAGRVDTHSALPDPVFSPRAALVFKPSEAQSFRVSFNRAFTTPSSLNQFLDLGSASPNVDLARLGFSLRVQGTGEEGFQFLQPGGGFVMRSPFTPVPLGGPAGLLPADVSIFYRAAVQVLAQGAAANGTPLPPSLVSYLLTLQPTGAQVGTNFLNPITRETGPLSTFGVDRIDPIRESTTNTLEVGYKGILGGRVLLAADVWYSRKEDLVTPLTIQSPLLTLNPQQLGAFLVPRFVADLGMSPAAATALATQLIGSANATGLATIPLGVVSSPDVAATGAQLLVTYVNVDETIELWGSDLSAEILIGNEWALGLAASFVSDDVFHTENAGVVTLNAPTRKGTLSVRYDDEEDTGVMGEFRVRHTNGFPVNSGVFIGTACLGVTTDFVEPCVDDYTLLDLNLGYTIPRFRNTTISLNITNLLDEDYRPFPGVPDIGRMALLRVKYEF
ncbi:MAG TPA: TonB-dependent receptor [Longimicrobiaceae bacterium]|nr:TonB-dependent receptor [Longimicrobiaceae bacterium]